MKNWGNRFILQIGVGIALLLCMSLFVFESPKVAEADHFDQPLDVEIKIKKINSIGCPDDWWLGCGNADYQLFVELDNVRHEYPKNSDGYVDDDNHISPNWVAPDSMNPHGPKFSNDEAKLKIGLWEVDGGLRFGDDHMDISPQNSRDIIGKIKWDHQDFTWAKVVLPGGSGSSDLEITLDPILPCCFGVTDYVIQGTSGDSDWRAKVTLDIKIKEAPGIGVEESGAKVRPLGIHSPLHPDPNDDLTITAGIVDEWGKAVNNDTIQIWIDPDGKNPHDDAYILSGNGTCWQDGTTSGSTCQETLDLSTIPEPAGLEDDEQRMIAYGIRTQDSGDHTAWAWSGWRLTTVGNRTNSSYIGFSLGNGEPRNAVDFLYTGHAVDYGAAGCSNQPVPVYAAGSLDPVPLYTTSTPQCTTPMDLANFLPMVRDNWSNTFMSSEDWSPTNWGNNGFTHLDVIASNLDKMNFWYTSMPAIGEGFSSGCNLSTPKILTLDPVTGLVVSASSYGWFEVAFLMHETPWRDCAPYGGKKVSIERNEYPTTLHEMGHRPFGLSDQYCCDGGYSQREHFPNVYKELDGYWSILFGDVAGCLDDPHMGDDGVPYPPSLIGCEEIQSSHPGGADWYSPQQTSQGLSVPNGELMSNHRAVGVPVDEDSVSDVPSGIGNVRVQAGPQTTKRILWFLSRCDSGAC